MSLRTAERRRAEALLDRDPRILFDTPARSTRNAILTLEPPRRLVALTREAGLRCSPWAIFALTAASALIAAIFSVLVLHPVFSPLLFFGGALLPFMWLERRAGARAAEFSRDYPTILLATASSVRAGLTVYAAIERSVRLLPKQSIARHEVEQLTSALHQGVPRDEALSRFAAGIRQPDLPLFRNALALALDHGGRFSPTLERLAHVCRERQNLIRTAKARTAGMRMTANILLGMTPLVVLMVAVRTENYLQILLEHPTANAMASTGVFLIGSSYALLRYMSNFRP